MMTGVMEYLNYTIHGDDDMMTGVMEYSNNLSVQVEGPAAK